MLFFGEVFAGCDELVVGWESFLHFFRETKENAFWTGNFTDANVFAVQDNGFLGFCGDFLEQLGSVVDFAKTVELIALNV